MTRFAGVAAPMRAPMSPFVALIPARMASTRLPGKPLADIGGLPMVVRVAHRARESGASRVVIATDSREVLAVALAHRIEAVMTRADHPSGTDRLAQAAEELSLREDEIVVNVQGDEPLIPPALVSAVAQLLERRADCAIATAAHPIATMIEYLNPNAVKVVTDATGSAAYFSRAPIPFDRDRLQGSPSEAPAGFSAAMSRASAAAPHRHLRLPGVLPARLPEAGARTGRDPGVARAAARALARVPDRGPARRRGAASGRRHHRRPGARARSALHRARLTGESV